MSQVANAAVLPQKKGFKVPGALLLDTFGLSPETMSPLEKRAAVSGYEVRHRIEAMVAGITGKKIKHTYQGDGARPDDPAADRGDEPVPDAASADPAGLHGA